MSLIIRPTGSTKLKTPGSTKAKSSGNGATNFYPNRPSAWTNSSGIDWSQAVPTPLNQDRPIAGTDWLYWQGAANPYDFTLDSDATAVQSPSSVWKGHWTPGSYGEAHTIPGAPYQVTVTWPANFGSSLSVYDLTADQYMTLVGSSPTTGQYSVASGVYTFAAADTGHSLLIAYSYSSTSGITNGATGLGGGHGIGNVFTYGPSNSFLTTPITRLYFSIRAKFEYPDASYWHSISNKFINIQTNSTLILVQLYESGQWRHAEELGNFSIGGSGGIAGQVSNVAVPINQYVHLETVIDLPNSVFKVWQDGVLTTDATPTFVGTSMNTIGCNAFRGGGGEALDADLYWKYDHFFIAW